MRYVILSVLVFSLLVGVASAQKIVAVTEDFEPYNYQENGVITGLSTEVVKATFAKAGIDVEIGLYPWARAYNMALEQENILIYSIGKSEAREKLFKWIGPIAPPLKVGLFKLKKRADITLQSLEDAKKYKIGVMKDSGNAQFLLSKGFEEGKQLEVTPMTSLNVSKLFAERIDLIASPEWWLLKEVTNRGFKAEDIEAAFIFSQDRNPGLYMAFSKKTSDEIVNRVRTAFDQLKAEGLLEKVEQTYREKYQ